MDKKDKENIKLAVKEWTESIVIAFILAFCIIRPFVVQAFKIPTGSMRPTLLEGDRILVSKFVYGAKVPFTRYRLPGFRKPQRGDIVVFISLDDKKKDFIKRLVGLPLDRVQIIDGRIYVNGKLLDLPQFQQRYYYNRGEFGREGQVIAVPPGCYYVLGDNSASSQDSRYFGFVPKNNVLGNAFFIWWPVQRIRLLK